MTEENAAAVFRVTALPEDIVYKGRLTRNVVSSFSLSAEMVPP